MNNPVANGGELDPLRLKTKNSPIGEFFVDTNPTI